MTNCAIGCWAESQGRAAPFYPSLTMLVALRSKGVAAALGRNLYAVFAKFRGHAHRRFTELRTDLVNRVAKRFVAHLTLTRNRFRLLSSVAGRGTETERQLHIVVVALEEG